MLAEAVPFGDWEVGVTCGEARSKVILPCLDCSFCCIATVGMGGNELVVIDVFFKCFLENCAAFVVEKMDVWGITGVS